MYSLSVCTKISYLHGVMAIIWCFPPKAVGFRAKHVILAEARRILSAQKCSPKTLVLAMCDLW